MKKIVPILLTVMMSVCMLTACGGGTESPDSPPEEAPATVQESTAGDDSQEPSVLEELQRIKDLEGKNAALVTVYNEVAALAVQNGWDADEDTVKFLGDADAVIKTYNGIISDPASAHDADLDEMVSLAEDLTTELDTSIRERVSAPYGG